MLYYIRLILSSFVSAINRVFSEYNQLKGTIPVQLGELTNLELLALGKSVELPRNAYYSSYPNAILHPTNIVFFCFRNQSFIFSC